MILRWFEHGQVYHPDKVLDPVETKRAEPFEDANFKAADGVSLNGWFFRAPRESPRKACCILLCHGNAGNISHRVDLSQTLVRLGLNVFSFDYRGFGSSEGRPSEEGTYLDGEAAIRWLEGKGFPSANVIAFGESLGGGIGSELALRVPLAGLVLQNTFTSIPDIGADLFPWMPVRWLATIKYDTRSKLPRLNIPIMVIHSRMDGLAGFHHAQKNFAAANEPKLFWETQGDHCDLLLDRPHFIEGMERFLGMVEAHQKAKSAENVLERNSKLQHPTSREARNPKGQNV
jgi:pimeloyl-ACP methyl ester carboxylesterase